MTNSNMSYEIEKVFSNKDFTCRRKITPLCHQPVFQDSALNIVTHKYIAGVVWLWREMCFSPGRAEQHYRPPPLVLAVTRIFLSHLLPYFIVG